MILSIIYYCTTVLHIKKDCHGGRVRAKDLYKNSTLFKTFYSKSLKIQVLKRCFQGFA